MMYQPVNSVTAVMVHQLGAGDSLVLNKLIMSVSENTQFVGLSAVGS